ncbi:MAG: Ig-like domain-containing protein [Thiomonas sp.]
MKNPIFRFFLAALMSLGVVALSSCGGGGGDPGTPILTNPPTIKLISLSGNAVPPNQTVVLQAQAFDQSGRGLVGVPVSFSLASNGAQGALSATTATTDADGVARVLYTAGPLQGSDIINATVTGAQSKTGTASLAMQVGVNPNAGPQVTVNMQTLPTAGQTLVAPNSTVQIMATVTSNGQPVANQPVVFNFGLASSGGTTSGPTLNGATSTVTATTNANGQATVTYVAGPQAGLDTVIATYSQNNVVLGIASVSITVQTSAEPTWKIDLSGTCIPNDPNCTTEKNAGGIGLSYKGIAPNGIGSNGVQSINYGVALQAKVTDKQGAAVPNAVVLFSLGSVSTSTGLPYCTPPALLTGGVCHTPTTGSAPAVPDTAPLVGNVNAGFASGTSTVVPTITAVTDANGVATARYVAGGSAGTDIVLVNAGYNTGTAAAPVLGTAQGTQSASMIVQ